MLKKLKKANTFTCSYFFNCALNLFWMPTWSLFNIVNDILRINYQEILFISFLSNSWNESSSSNKNNFWSDKQTAHWSWMKIFMALTFVKVDSIYIKTKIFSNLTLCILSLKFPEILAKHKFHQLFREKIKCKGAATTLI